MQPESRDHLNSPAQGSGVVISNSRVLTAQHLNKFNNLWINGVEVLVVKQDRDKDLMLLDWPNAPYVKQIEFCSPEVGEEVYYVGYPLGHKKAFTVFGRVTALDGDDIYTDAAALHGVSGSGLYCKDGRLAGIVTSLFGVPHVGYPFAVAVNSRAIQKFLK